MNFLFCNRLELLKKGLLAQRVLSITLSVTFLAALLAVLLMTPGVAKGAMDEFSDGGASTSVSSSESATSDSSSTSLEQLTFSSHLYRLSGSTTPAASSNELTKESVGALYPSLLAVSTQPASLQTGIACHMDEYCGIDPCTCGKPDAWGHCACGGFEETRPTITIVSSNEDIVVPVEAFGVTWLVPKSAGLATITISAELIHYQGTSYTFQVEVAPFGIIDVLLIVVNIVLIAALFVGIFLLIRVVTRMIKKHMIANRAWKERGEKLKEEYPLTWQAKLDHEKYAGTWKAHRRRVGSRYPFAHDMWYALRGVAPVLLAGLVLFAVLVPISTSVVNDISIFNVNFTHDQLKYQLYAQDLAPVVNAASVLYGAVLAITLFRFLMVKRATTAYFSVGLSRVKLFLSRYLVGFACVLVGIGIPFVVSFVLNATALGIYDGFVPEFFYVMCGYMVIALVSFSLAGIAVVRAGTLFEACAFTVALLGGVSVVLWGMGILADFLLVGNAAGASLYGQESYVDPSYIQSLSWLNPLLFFAEEGASHQYFLAMHPVYYPEVGNWWRIVAWFVVYLVLCAVGLLAFCKRAGEQAEIAGKAPVLSLVSVAVFGLVAFAAAVALLGSVDVAVALAVAVVLFLLVSLVFMFGPLRGRTPRGVTLGCVGTELACMACVVVVMATGAFGFSSYVPESSQVESVEVSYNGSPSYLTQGFSGVSGGSSYYYTSYRTYTDTNTIDIVCAVHKQLIESAHDAQETNYTNFESTPVPYDVVIRYSMKDGTTIVRYFNQASIGELSGLLSLDNDKHAHELVRAAITGETSSLSESEQTSLSKSPSYNAYRSGYIYAADGALNRIVQIECSDYQRKDLLNALAADLGNLSAQQLYQPSKATRYALMFTLSPESDVSSFGYSFSNAVSYITDDWENTMVWFEENGYAEVLGESLDARIIEKLTLQLDDPYVSINKVTQPVARYFMAYRTSTSGSFWITQDYGALKTITTQSQIAEMLPNLRTGCYMTGGYLVQAKLSGIEAYVYFYLPSDLVPDYL